MGSREPWPLDATQDRLEDNRVRRVTEIEVHDGDTFRCRVDLGFFVSAKMLCRIDGINAPELAEPGGGPACLAVAAMLAGGDVYIQSFHVDKFAGRFDAAVWVDSGLGEPVNVAQYLIDNGLAVEWDGKGAKPKVPWPPDSGY